MPDLDSVPWHDVIAREHVVGSVSRPETDPGHCHYIVKPSLRVARQYGGRMAVGGSLRWD